MEIVCIITLLRVCLQVLTFVFWLNTTGMFSEEQDGGSFWNNCNDSRRSVCPEGKRGSTGRRRFLSLVLWSVGTVTSVYRRVQGSEVSESWRPEERGWLESWSERHCWNCSPLGWQKHFRFHYLPLLQECSVLPETGVREGCSLSGWGER